MANQFLTDSEFEVSSTRIIKWGDLPLEVTYRVNEICEKVVNMGGKDVNCKYAILEDKNGVIKKSWLTSIIENELNGVTISERNVYIRSYGLKSNKVGSRKYYDFEIVKKN